MYTAKEVLVTFNVTINGSEEIYRAVARSFGLSDCAFWILYCIRQSEEKVTQKDICSFIYQPKQTVHSALKKMVEDGLIEIGDYNGKRHKYVTLTEKGEAFSKKQLIWFLRKKLQSLRIWMPRKEKLQ
jgi:DNA-binding MarR family transcriptional regulator